MRVVNTSIVSPAPSVTPAFPPLGAPHAASACGGFPSRDRDIDPEPSCRTPPVSLFPKSATANRTFAPVDFPIQLRCMVMTRSGHPPSSNFKSSSSCSAYAVVFKNHCSSSRDSTSVSSCRQQYPFTTCSLASTVQHLGHQFTRLFCREASPRSNIRRKNHWFHR